ncbi:MAG: A24 family peptidase [Chloroflexota bacterium]
MDLLAGTGAQPELWLRVLSAALLGWPAGALVVLIARSLPAQERVLAWPACAACGDRVPGWAASQLVRLVLPSGSCQRCGAVPSRGDLSLELATIATFAVLGWRFDDLLQLLAHLFFAVVLLVVFAVDLRYREVYLVVAYGGLLGAFALSIAGVSGGPFSAFCGSLFGALAFGGLFVAGKLVYRGQEPLGSGDITIAAVLGAMAGFPNIIWALAQGMLFGGLGAAYCLISGRNRQAFMPYGPALCLGGFLTFLTS